LLSFFAFCLLPFAFKNGIRIMRKILCLIAFLIGTKAALNGEAAYGEQRVEFELSSGYRQDKLAFGVKAFDLNEAQALSNFSRFTSRVTWEDLQIYQIYSNIKIVSCDRLYFRAVADYGWIYHGRNHDKDILERNEYKCEPSSYSDYGRQSDRVLMASRADANGGAVFDLSTAIGYNFTFQGGRGTIALLSGYGWHEQQLRMNNLVVEKDLIDFITGPVDGLHSNYRARWRGPFGGADFRFGMTCATELFGGFELHWASFRGRGHWNLRPDFVRDFRQTAYALGQVYNLGIRYFLARPWNEWGFGVLFNYQRWTTLHGHNKIFLAHYRHFKSRLQPVRWFSWSLMANITYIYW
jgi:hypothetical protein